MPDSRTEFLNSWAERQKDLAHGIAPWRKAKMIFLRRFFREEIREISLAVEKTVHDGLAQELANADAQAKAGFEHRQEFEKLNAEMNKLALWLRENKAEQIARGEHAGMSLSEAILRYAK